MSENNQNTPTDGIFFIDEFQMSLDDAKMVLGISGARFGEYQLPSHETSGNRKQRRAQNKKR